MSKNPSLYHQMYRAVESAFTPGQSKHAAEEYERRARVYSYEYRQKLNDFSADFSKYIKTHYPEIKLIKEIEPDHVSEYLEAKHDAGCSDSYVKSLTSYASKLGHLTSNLYQCDINWHDDVKTPEIASKTAEIEPINDISVDDWSRLKEHIEEKDCQSSRALVVAAAFGLRVSELTKICPADISDDSLHIHRSKGGRSRDLEVRTDEQREAIEMLKELSKDLDTLERVFTVKGSSINKFYRENASAVGIEDCEVYGVHQLRRLHATEYYHELKEDGYSELDACDAVSEWLGHGKNRSDIIKLYVNRG